MLDGWVVATMMATLAAVVGVLTLSGGPRSKTVIILCVAIGLLGLATVVRQVAGIIKRQRIRQGLAERLEKGRELFHAIDYRWPREVAVELLGWANSVEATLRDWKDDGSYVTLFRPPEVSNDGIILESFPEDTPEAIAAFGQTLVGTTDPRWITSGRFEQDLRFNSAHGFRKSLRGFMVHRLRVLEEFVREIKD